MRTLTIIAVCVLVMVAFSGCGFVRSMQAGVEVHNSPSSIYLTRQTIYVKFIQDGTTPFKGGVVTVTPVPTLEAPASWDVPIRKGQAEIYLPTQCSSIILNIAYGRYSYGPIVIPNNDAVVNCTEKERSK